MKPSLQLGISQSLTMTPQLQQAIKLLAMSTLELQQEVQAALDDNPLLELDDGQGSDDGEHIEAAPKEEPVRESLDLDKHNQLSDDLPVDTAWDDIYIGSNSGSGGEPVDEDGEPIEARKAAIETLQDHLHWQLNVTPFSTLDRVIAEAIIDGLDSRGYLTVSLDELAETALSWCNEEAEEDEVIAVLHRIQRFDPPGVAAAPS